MKTRAKSKRDVSGENAFTLTELIVVVATLAALVVLALPALSASGSAGNAIVCQNNFRQLTMAWAAYSVDNNDKVCRTGGSDIDVSNPDNPSAKPGHILSQWVLGNMMTIPGNTNFAFIKAGLLYPYVRNVMAYKCPSDPRTAD